MKPTICYLLFAICFAVAIASRLLPHAPNFTAIGALALFAGVCLPRRWSLFAPLGALLVTDFVLGFYEPVIMLSVYGSFTAVGLVGWYIRKQKTPANLLVGALSASIIFFVITNAAVWAFTPWYPKTFAGLFQSFALAVPFYRNMLFGDLFWSGVFFGVYGFLRSGFRVTASRATPDSLPTVL